MSARVATLLAVVVALLASAAPAQAVPEAQRGEAFNRLEKKVMCIECNVALNIAEAPQADATRAQIRRLLDRDLSEQQVLDQLVEDYGANVLASPEAKGISAFAYLVPIAALAALLAAGVVLLPRWRRARAAAGRDDDHRDGGPDPLSRAENERLDAELARYGA